MSRALLCLLLVGCPYAPTADDVTVTFLHPRTSGIKKMQPEQLADVLERSFGQRWLTTAGDDALLDTNYKIYMGGVDYVGILERSDGVDPTFSLVTQRLANEYCATLSLTSFDALGLSGLDLDSVDASAGGPVRTGLERMYRSVRSRPMEPATQDALVGVFTGPELATASGVTRWQAMCTVIFLLEGSVAVY